MKKQEMVHLHSLLSQVQDGYEKRTDHEIEHDKYSEIDVRPTSIHKSKTDHKKAVLALGSDLSENLGQTLDFEDDVLLDGLLKSKTEDESRLARICANITKESPETVAAYAPVLISFIRTGDTSTQRHAVQAIKNIADNCPHKLNPYLSEFYESTKYVHEISIKSDLQSVTEQLRSRKGLNE